MPRLFAVVFAGFLVLVSAAVTARDTPEAHLAALPAGDEADLTMVEGVAIGDLLNVRAKASPMGTVMGRLPNGSILRKHECDTFNGYEWCRIDALEVEGLSGWAPARYLRGLDIEDAATGAIEQGGHSAAAANAAAAAAPQEAAAGARADEQPDAASAPASAIGEQVADVPVPTPSPLREAQAAGADEAVKDDRVAVAEGERGDTAVPLPPGLETRFGDAPSSVALSLAAASETAYYIALRNGARAAPAEIAPGIPAAAPALPDLPVASQPDAAAADVPAAAQQPAAAEEAPPPPVELAALIEVAAVVPAADEPEVEQESAWSVPIPTPRPEREGERIAVRSAPVAQLHAVAPPAAAQIVVAQAETRSIPQSLPIPAGADAVGEIPCARYIGQPMTRCVASVVRHGDDAADVTIAWPDGGDRVINFRDGAPAGSNSRQEFRVVREGTLNLIRVGISERFEIVDAVAFGD